MKRLVKDYICPRYFNNDAWILIMEATLIFLQVKGLWIEGGREEGWNGGGERERDL